MSSDTSEEKETDTKSKCEVFRSWLSGPTCLIYINYFCSQWGDWMWLFASGLYLVHLDGGMLRLAAAFGFAGGGCVLLFGGLVGEWVDRNQRLYVVRVALFVQNAAVMLCAVTVCLALHFEVHEEEIWSQGMKQACEVCIVLFAIVAQLSSVAYKISIEKDWIVVVAADNKALLANMNAMTRTLDLFAKILAPTFVGLVMTYASLMISAICIAVWNLLSVWLEYGLLYRIYNLVPELHNKTLRTSPAGKEKGKQLDDMVMVVVVDDQPEQRKEEEADQQNNDMTQPQAELQPLKSSEEAPQSTEPSGSAPTPGCIHTMFEPFIILVQGWKTYARQPVVYAGLSLSMLYMTVMGFDSVTTGYIYSNNVPAYAVGVSMALAGGTGILGAFLFTFLRNRNGLERTGLYAFNIEILCLMLAVASVWAPGSPFDLHYASKVPPNCSLALNSSRVHRIQAGFIAIQDDNQEEGNNTRSKRSVAFHPLSMFHPEEFDLATFGHYIDITFNHEMDADFSSSWMKRDSWKDVSRRMKRDSWEDVSAAQLEYSVLQPDSDPKETDDCNKSEDGVNISIILFLIGIILSRIGLWMADLVVTQLLQENVIETERGIVNGIQNSINMLLEMLKFILVIVAPRIETFGILIILSFIFICLAGMLFSVHSYRVRGHLFHFEKCVCNNNLPEETEVNRQQVAQVCNGGKAGKEDLADV